MILNLHGVSNACIFYTVGNFHILCKLACYFILYYVDTSVQVHFCNASLLASEVLIIKEIMLGWKLEEEYYWNNLIGLDHSIFSIPVTMCLLVGLFGK